MQSAFVLCVFIVLLLLLFFAVPSSAVVHTKQTRIKGQQSDFLFLLGPNGSQYFSVALEYCPVLFRIYSPSPGILRIISLFVLDP